MNIIDGTKIAIQILHQTQRKVTLLKKKGIIPHLGVVLVGDDPRSAVYIRSKEKAALDIGIKFTLFPFDKKISEIKLLEAIKNIQKKNKLTGLIVQLPLPEHLYTPHILNAIDPRIDVDCLTHENLGKLIMKWGELFPPTAAAVMEVIRSLSIELPGKQVVILGAGALVGKPLSIMLMNARATVTICNSATKNIQKVCKSADIIVSGVGKKDLIRGTMIQSGAVVIDTGISFEKNKLYGDVNMKEVAKKASAVTPTPGGIGPITVAQLLSNTVLCAKLLTNKKKTG